MLTKLKAGPNTAGPGLHTATCHNGQVYHEADKFRSCRFPDFEDIDGPRNFGLRVIRPPEAHASSTVYCLTEEYLHRVVFTTFNAHVLCGMF